jgi:hypothetical protein
MGSRRGVMRADFPVGTMVRIGPRTLLERYVRPAWKFHNPLDPQQLEHAGRIVKVSQVGFYHGGDELYNLEGVPGTWHEACLEAAE